jgi:hypothetical protein
MGKPMSNRSLYELFSSRFEPDGSDYLFRASEGAPGVRVSASERDRFVAQFQTRWLWLRWGTFAAFIVAICVVAWLIIASIVPEAWLLPLIWGSLALLAAPYFVIYHLLWTAPARALQSRAEAAPAHSLEDVRNMLLEWLRWRQLRETAVKIAPTIWQEGKRRGATLLANGSQALRKWRSSSTPQS